MIENDWWGFVENEINETFFGESLCLRFIKKFFLRYAHMMHVARSKSILLEVHNSVKMVFDEFGRCATVFYWNMKQIR